MDREKRSRRAQVHAVFDEPGLGRHIAAIRTDQGRRVATSRVPDRVVTVTEFPRKRRSVNTLTPIEGSIMLFWARPGSDILGRLEEAYERGDQKTLQEVDEIIAGQLVDEPIPTMEAASAAVLSSPMHFDVRYGSKVLSRTLTLPEGAEICFVVFPYNGGNLDDSAFAIDQFHRVGETVEYPTLLVKVPPRLSAVEIEAINAVPADQVGINIGEASCCPAVTALVLIAVALATHAGIWQEMGDQMNRVTLTKEQIAQLGPMATARELVALRREIFEAHGI
ncbi:hypothetical protein [Granulicoccus phenolivorans]|uniref:hypothetical protein n=1 Tax=Granulicoccus phenolivorans TaxID=266854 RepID=UPI00047C0DD1|nr:hypothetical protein [Granulicoccus phenolivorans]